MGAAIAAGPSNSVVIDKQGMYWMAGKVLTFGAFFSCYLDALMLPFSGRTVAKVMFTFNID
jgi:hypothetical protein